MSGDPTKIEISVTTELDGSTADAARQVLRRAQPIELRDDRFDGWPRGDGSADIPFVAAIATDDGEPVGFVGGTATDGRLQLDALASADLDAAAGAVLDDLLDAVIDCVTDTDTSLDTARPDGDGAPTSVEWWGKPATDAHGAVADHHGLAAWRSLYQMRCPLPVDVDPLPTRAFDAADLDALLEVNNRAFSAHPDQGGLTVDDLRATLEAPWFSADGLRIHERDGRIAGFCWTKIHPARVDDGERSTELGEIYVIGVDPDYHGQGLGVPMTAAGLVWLHQQGPTTGMLYVEADNVPAVRTYERLGFTVARTDRAWSGALQP